MVDDIMAGSKDVELDTRELERAVITSAQRMAFGQEPDVDPLTRAAAAIMLKEFDFKRVVPNCSNSALRYSVSVSAIPVDPEVESKT